MWHEARKHEKKLRGMMVDYRRRAERRREFYDSIRRDPASFLQIHGQQMKVHIDPVISQAAEQSLMPWMGDPKNLIDRFDVRAHLDYIPTASDVAPIGAVGGPAVELTAEQECQLNYERYRPLVNNDFLNIPEAKYLNQIYLEERCGQNSALKQRSDHELKKKLAEKKAAIGYSYEDSEPPVRDSNNPSDSDESDSEADEEEEELEDMDNTVQVDQLNEEMRHRICLLATKYGVNDKLMLKFMNIDKEETEKLRIAKEIENEKSMFVGRKSRRERKELKQQRMLILRSINVDDAAGDHFGKGFAVNANNNGASDDSSSDDDESVKSDNVDESKVEFITCFGSSSDEDGAVQIADKKKADKNKGQKDSKSKKNKNKPLKGQKKGAGNQDNNNNGKGSNMQLPLFGPSLPDQKPQSVGSGVSRSALKFNSSTNPKNRHYRPSRKSDDDEAIGPVRERTPIQQIYGRRDKRCYGSRDRSSRSRSRSSASSRGSVSRSRKSHSKSRSRRRSRSRSPRRKSSRPRSDRRRPDSDDDSDDHRSSDRKRSSRHLPARYSERNRSVSRSRSHSRHRHRSRSRDRRSRRSSHSPRRSDHRRERSRSRSSHRTRSSKDHRSERSRQRSSRSGSRHRRRSSPTTTSTRRAESRSGTKDRSKPVERTKKVEVVKSESKAIQPPIVPPPPPPPPPQKPSPIEPSSPSPPAQPPPPPPSNPPLNKPIDLPSIELPSPPSSSTLSLSTDHYISQSIPFPPPPPPPPSLPSPTTKKSNSVKYPVPSFSTVEPKSEPIKMAVPPPIRSYYRHDLEDDRSSSELSEDESSDNKRDLKPTATAISSHSSTTSPKISLSTSLSQSNHDESQYSSKFFQSDPPTGQVSSGKTPATTSGFSRSSNVTASATVVTPQERLRRLMQAQLDKEYKRDKKAEAEKLEKQKQEKLERDEELYKMTNRLNEKRYGGQRDYSRSASRSSASRSSRSSSSDSDSSNGWSDENDRRRKSSRKRDRSRSRSRDRRRSRSPVRSTKQRRHRSRSYSS